MLIDAVDVVPVSTDASLDTNYEEFVRIDDNQIYREVLTDEQTASVGKSSRR